MIPTNELTGSYISKLYQYFNDAHDITFEKINLKNDWIKEINDSDFDAKYSSRNDMAKIKNKIIVQSLKIALLFYVIKRLEKGEKITSEIKWKDTNDNWTNDKTEIQKTYLIVANAICQNYLGYFPSESKSTSITDELVEKTKDYIDAHPKSDIRNIYINCNIKRKQQMSLPEFRDFLISNQIINGEIK